MNYPIRDYKSTPTTKEESPEMCDEEYYRMAEQAYQHELDRDLELDRDYEANMPLSPSGAGIVYGGSDDIPF